jgi:hypothetical protein
MTISLAAVRAVLWRSALFALLWLTMTDGRVAVNRAPRSA